MKRGRIDSFCESNIWPGNCENLVIGNELDTGCEEVVTDFVQELSSGLQIPFLLGEGSNTEIEDSINEQVAKIYETNCVFPESYGDTFNLLSFDDLGSELRNETDLQDFFIKDEVHTPVDSSASGTGSGSECSASDLWTVKNDLDTPPVTPPEQNTQSDGFFVYTSNNTNINCIPSGVGVNGKTKRKDICNVRRKVRIQPKPHDVSFSAPVTTLLDQSTCGVFSSSSSSRSSPEYVHLYEVVQDTTTETRQVVSWEETERLQAMRKRDRMIRNRESACLSRKKKKEYVTQLEQHVETLTNENTMLRQENSLLRDKLTKYGEPPSPPPPSTWTNPASSLSPQSKKTTALFAVMLTVCLNIGSFNNILSEKAVDTNLENEVSAIRVGPRYTRSLLWTDSDLELTNVTHTSCPLSINQTESIRLESELRRWIGTDDESVRMEKRNSSKISQYFDASGRGSKPKRKAKQRFRKGQYLLQEDLYGVKSQVFAFGSLLQGIHLRDDTFYLVSFSGDHLLLPALAHNDTTRPKMSLVLPAASTNSSMGPFEMMQIDCEVTNTQLVNMKQHGLSNSTARGVVRESASFHSANLTATSQNGGSQIRRRQYVGNTVNDTNSSSSSSSSNNTEYFSTNGKDMFNYKSPVKMSQDLDSGFGALKNMLMPQKRAITFVEMLKNDSSVRDFKVGNMFINNGLDEQLSRK